MAPLIVALVGLFTGAGAGAYAFPALTGAVKTEAVIAGLYADLPTICAATQPVIDQLALAAPRSKALVKLSYASGAVCAAAKRPDNPIDQARLIIDLVQAIHAANVKIAASQPVKK